MNGTPFTIMVRKALIDRGMRQKDLAEKIGVSQNYLNHMLTGRKNPGKYEIPIRAALGLVDDQLKHAG